MAKKGSVEKMIHALDKGEKRYFKLFCRFQSGNKQYLELFDLIESNSSENNRPLKTLECTDLAVTKNYLGRLVLKSLKSYHEGKTKRSEILHLLLETEVLFQKELYDLCLHKLKKARRIAFEYENHSLLLEVLSWERRLINTTATEGAKRVKEEIMTLEAKTVDVLDNYNKYNQLVHELLQQDFSDRQLMLEYLQHPLLQSKDFAKSFSALTLYYHLHYILNTLTRQGKKGRTALEALIKLMESAPHRIEDDPDPYVTALNNLMSMMLFDRETGKAVPILKKIRSIPSQYHLKQKNYTQRIFLKTYNVELELYRDLKAWDQALKLMTEIRAFLDAQVVSNKYQASFHYQFAYIYFQLKEYSQSLAMINHLLNENYGQDRADLQTYARFLLLMVHFELGNIIVLKYAVENTRRFLKKRRGSLLNFESALLKFFAKVSLAPSREYQDHFKELSTALFQGHSKEQRANILDYIDFESWIHSKLIDTF